jgi:hypothetical protein
VVPITLDLDETHRTLLISGPNTGGKTVSMKTGGTAGFSWRTPALPVPAEEAEFPLFEQVLADIGDQQSIQESLSSFSAHIAHVSEMLQAVTPASRWCCWTNWGAPRIPKKAERWAFPFSKRSSRERCIYAGIHAPGGAEDLRRHHGGRGERFHGIR